MRIKISRKTAWLDVEAYEINNGSERPAIAVKFPSIKHDFGFFGRLPKIPQDSSMHMRLNVGFSAGELSKNDFYWFVCHVV